MADLNEEQLLNDLLRDVGAADRRLPVSDLEARVLAAWDAQAAAPKRGRTPFSRVYYVFGIAAMVTLAVTPTLWKAPATTPPPVAPLAPVASTFAPPNPRATVDKPIAPDASTFAPPNPRATVDKPVAPNAPLAPVEVAASPIEFIPLVPVTEDELAGPFQIVRVQMPRASLGPLTSPMHHPSELVEADVLLGEDGMARAIHVSTKGSAYPWRSR